MPPRRNSPRGGERPVQEDAPQHSEHDRVDVGIDGAGLEVPDPPADELGDDRNAVDGAVNGVAVVTQFVGRRIRNLQTGAVNAYVYAIVLGVLGSVFLY